MHARNGLLRASTAGAALLVLVACDQPLDFDLRSAGNGFDTSAAVRQITAERPQPDDRGVLSYPGYQVALANDGDTVNDVAARVGLPASQVARFNGIPENVPLRGGEVIALPERVAEPSPETGAIGTGPIRPSGSVDVAAVAGQALDRGADPAASPQAGVQTGQEPRRHRVEPGETAFSIARTYNVPVDALAEWNGLGTDLSLRAGQYLLIPTALEPPPAVVPTPPGRGSLAPEPPSAAKPLPTSSPQPAAAAPATAPQAAPAEAETARLRMPVAGKIVRTYEKGTNDGIGIAAPPGTPVSAAEDGTVAAITRDTDQVPIMVIRHAGNILTVYAGIDSILVSKGDTVKRGQPIAQVRAADPSFLHFEVREGFESTDPVRYLN